MRVRPKSPQDQRRAVANNTAVERARTIHHPLDRRAMTGPRVRNARQSLQNLIGPDVVSGSKAVVEAMSDQPGEADVKGVLAKPQRRCASC